MVKEDNDVDSTEDIETPPIIGGVQLKYGDGDPIEYQEIERIEPMSNDVTKGNPGSTFKTIGIVAILYGIIVGVFIFLGSFHESPLFGFVLALGVVLLFVVPGVICIGISRILIYRQNKDLGFVRTRIFRIIGFPSIIVIIILAHNCSVNF